MSRKPMDLLRIIHGTLFGDAVNDSSVATLLATDDGQYVAANDAACRLTGYGRSELVKFRAGQLAGDDASKQIYDAIIRRQELEGTKTLRRRDGGLIRCRYQAIPTNVAMLPHYLLMLRPADSTTQA